MGEGRTATGGRNEPCCGKAEDPPCSKLVRNTTEHTVDTHADNGKAKPYLYLKHINSAKHCKSKSAK